MDSGFPSNLGFSSRLPGLHQARTENGRFKWSGTMSVEQDPRKMTANDWHNVLFPLPVWRGWSVNPASGSLKEAEDTAFEPHGPYRRTIPLFEIQQGAGEKRIWRIENSFDDTLSNNGFQQLGARASFEPYLWKFKVFDAASDITGRARQRSVQTMKTRQEGFMVKEMHPRVRVRMMGKQSARLRLQCKAELWEIQTANSEHGRELLYKFLAKYGEYFSSTFVLGGHLSHYYTATSISGETMDEKEKELEAKVSGAFAFFSFAAPSGLGKKNSSKKSQSVLVDETLIIPFGGARNFSNIEEWEHSLGNPLLWGVIERDQPKPLVDFIAALPGWEWLLTTIDKIALAAPLPESLSPIRRSRYFSPDTSIISIVTDRNGIAFLFFQDHNGWINWGLYHLNLDKELIFPQPIVQAQQSSPIAACAFPDTGETSSEGWIIDLFFINTDGFIADIGVDITVARQGILHIFPPSISKEWSSGTLHNLELRINPASKIAASRARNDEVILVFEQGLPLVQSHIFEAIQKGEDPWEVLPRPNYQLEAFGGGPLSIYHMDGEKGEYAILHHSNTTGTLVASSGNPDLESPYSTEEIMPSSRLQSGVNPPTTSRRDKIRVSCMENAWSYGRTYVAVRNDDNTVDVLFWESSGGEEGRTIKTHSRVCKTRAQTDFCLTEVKNDRLLIFYVSVDGYLEVALLKLDMPPLLPERISRRPIFMDCCLRCLEEEFTSEAISDESSDVVD